MRSDYNDPGRWAVLNFADSNIVSQYNEAETRKLEFSS